MPSLLRFLFVIGVLAGLVYGGMLALVTLFEPQPREITIVVPPDRFMKR
ncbi:MAG TPA: histidine kinase [Xanthobacteraceae bacterium]|nr:histidine kinase [Xanthobacteraceae bacterium]